jgi:2-haloalkanoic acid dehalogenase type II
VALTNIKVIAFDGDGTLWDFERVMRHSLEIVLAQLRRRLPGQATDELTVARMIEIRNQVAFELKGIVTNLEQVRHAAFCRTLEIVGVSDENLAAELNALYLKHRFEDIELYPDVLPCLDALRERYVVGLLSNGNSYPERCGLGNRFQFVVFSQDVGVEKPDRRIFEVTCEKAGCQPHEFLMVGDSLVNDVAGAQSFGARGVWLNRLGLPCPAEIRPDLEVRLLRELPVHIAEISA